MPFRAVVSLACLCVLAVRPLPAQRALGMGGDAATLPAGVFRISASAIWDRANERYDANGTLYPLGANASTASWDGTYDARLNTAGGLVATLAGQPSFSASLGALAIGRRDASADAALAVEAGLMARLTVGARVQMAAHTIEPRVLLNAGRVEGTMGLNPAWSNANALSRNAAVVTQFDSAVAQTGRRIAQCQATPSTPGCAAILANVAAAQSLVTSATAFAAALNQLYGGRKAAVGLPFVPVGGSAAHLAITQRILGYRDQFAALGVSSISEQGPAAAALLSPADLATLLTDTLYGYGLRRVRTVHAYGIGDVAVHAKFRVFDMLGADTAQVHGFKLRQAVSAAVRVDGGSAPAPAEPFAPVTGEGGGSVTLRSFTDLFYGNRWSATVVMGLERPQAQDYAMRIPPADGPTVGGLPFPLQPASREARFTRTPGMRLEVAVTPRVAIARNVWLGASWRLARQNADRWNALVSNAGAAGWSAQDIAAWTAGTDWSEQQFSLGGTYSTVQATRHGRAALPFDVTYEHAQTIAGRGWRVAHLSRDVVTVRWYPRLWGRP